MGLNKIEKPKEVDSDFRIALAFPELGKHDLLYFKDQLLKITPQLDLIVFPEAFETIDPSNKSNMEILPEKIHENTDVKKLVSEYLSLAKQYKCGIIVGFAVKYNDTFISGSGNDQYCLFIDDKQNVYIYHKHSTSKYTALFDSNWSIDNNLKVVSLKNKKIGISVCHDSYISLIPRVFKTKNADIWVNISYRNVRPNIWESIHLTRSVENNNISVCTLHRALNKKHPHKEQKEPYAFSPSGKIKLHDLISGECIKDINKDERTGRIFFFDCVSHENYQADSIKTSDIAAKAEHLQISKINEKMGIIPKNQSFIVSEIDVKTFFCPELLWKIFFENNKKIVLFVVLVEDEKEWLKMKDKIHSIIKGRTIEFSTGFIFLKKNNPDNIFLAAYRSSNYKDTRIFEPKSFPILLDQRYLKGLSSVQEISLKDDRKLNKEIYINRISQILSELNRKNSQT